MPKRRKFRPKSRHRDSQLALSQAKVASIVVVAIFS
jgi:hypothetical protein